MHLTSNGYISIVQLVVYVPCLALAFKVCLRHGFGRASGWIFALILCVIRIAGAVCQLLTYSHPSEGLIKATLIIDSIGIAPLLLITLGVLHRLVDWVNASVQNPRFTSRFFRILQIAIAAGLLLGIIGVTNGGSQSSNGSFVPSGISRAGIIIYVAVWAAITLIFILSIPNFSAVPKEERLLRIHIPVALVTIAVRLLYAALCVFVHNKTFSLFSGSIIPDILMAIVEEFFVVVITLLLGFKLNPLPPSTKDEAPKVNRRRWNQGHQVMQTKDGIFISMPNSGFEMSRDPHIISA